LLAPINFQFPAGAFGTFPSTGPIPAKNTEVKIPGHFNTIVLIQAAQPLSQIYKIGLGVNIRRISQDIESEQLRRERQGVVNEVKCAYYDIAGTQSALEANETSLEALRELDRYINQQVQQETVLKVDRLEVETRLSQQEFNQLKLRDALATQKEQMNHLLARDLETDFSVEPAPPVTESDLDLTAAHAKALQQRPEIRMAELGVRESEYDLRLKKADYIPDISLTVTYLSPFNIKVIPKNIATAGIQLTWEPFDWGRRHHEIEAKRLAVEQQKQRVEDTREQVLVEVSDRLRKLREATAFLKVAQLTLETAQERLRVSTNQFKQQAALLKDVLQNQSSLADSSDQYQKALLAFSSAKADFERALGEEQ